jgi:hypothetical protein
VVVLHAEGDSTIASGIFHMLKVLKLKPLILVVMLKVIQLKLMVLLVTLVVLIVKLMVKHRLFMVLIHTTGTNTIVFGSGISGTSSDTMYVDNLNKKHLLVVLVLVTLGVTSTGKVVIANYAKNNYW